jgi:hypothetical protein
LWAGGVPQAGSPASTTTGGTVIEEIGFFYGLGAVIIFLAALALGRFSVVAVKDAELAMSRSAAAPPPMPTMPMADGPAETG